MQIAESTEAGATVVVLDGRLDEAGARATEGSLLALAASGPLVVDLAGVPFLGSSGLRVLLRAAKQASAGGHRFVLCAAQPAIEEVFLTSGFDAVIRHVPTRAEALRG